MLDVDFDNICRLCLTQHGMMNSIYDVNGQSTVTEGILSLASVQIFPNDGLPGTICDSCSEKVDKFVKFREQIENSYFILCQCIGGDSNDPDTSSFVNTDPGTSENGLYDPAKLREKEKPLKIKSILGKDIKVKDNEVTNSLSSLFKDHLVSGISNCDLLVNPQDGYISVSNVNCSSIADESEVYKNPESFMIGVSEESISDSQQPSLLAKDLNAENITDIAFNIKLHEGSADSKIYNISFSDNNQDNPEVLQDIFQEFDSNENGCQTGFDDITKFLKSSQNIDFKKLKEEIKIIKDKNERNECDSDIDPDSLLKKLASRGVTFVKAKEDADVVDLTFDKQRSHKSEILSPESTSILNGLLHEEDLVPEALSNTLQISDSESPDIIFASMLAKERENYTKALFQEEFSPRITEIFSIQVNKKDHTQIVEGGSEKDLLKFRTYMCHLCLSEFRECDLSVLEAHSQSHFNFASTPVSGTIQHQPLFKCEFCGGKFNDRYLFTIHQRKHLGIVPFECFTCNKSFSQVEIFDEHTATHKKSVSNQFPCLYCGEVFRKKQELQYHEKSHVPNAPLICTTCHKTFSNLVTLKMHRKRHTEGSKHCCQKCGKSFFSNTQLKRHDQSHSGVRRFPCNFCTKAFYSNAERRRHLLYHFKTKKFKCNDCDKAFYESGHLTIHMRTHTNFKPYICDVCGKGFPTRVKLTRHIKMHERHNMRPSEILDRQTSKKSMPDAGPKISKTKVTPKFTKLNPANKKVNGISNILSGNVASSNSLVSMEVLNSLGLEDLPDDEEESYIIIEEGDEGDDTMPDLSSFNGVQVFTDDIGQVFYVLDDEEFSNLNNPAVKESANS